MLCDQAWVACPLWALVSLLQSKERTRSTQRAFQKLWGGAVGRGRLGADCQADELGQVTYLSMPMSWPMPGGRQHHPPHRVWGPEMSSHT